MTTETVQHVTVLHRLDVHLADREFGNDLMAKVAAYEFTRHKDLPQLFVMVVEHGGWWLQFAKDGTIIGTANDCAVLSMRAKQIGADSHNCKTVWLPAIWRQEFYSSITRAVMSAKYVVDDSLNGRTFAEYQRSGPHPLKGPRPLPDRFRVVGWIHKKTLQPCSVLVHSYLGVSLTDEEAIELAGDYLREIKALKGCDLDKPDFIH